LEQFRSMAADSLTNGGAGTLTPQLQKLHPDKLQAMMLGAPRWSSDASLIFTQYDIQALAQKMRRDPQLAWKLLAKAGASDSQHERLLQNLQQLRNDQGGLILPPEMAELVKKWTAGTEPGWAQIMATVNGLKGHAVHDPQAIVPADEPDSVRYFLIESRRGPDYLFASSAVVLLRSLGYPSRLVGGYYAKNENRSWMTGKTDIREDDVHYWAQVQLPDQLWVDVEPTPGFEIPSADADSISAETAPGFGAGFALLGLIALAGAAGLSLALFLLRRQLRGVWLYWSWRCGLSGSPVEIATRTQRLIRYRLQQAGQSPGAGASFQSAVLSLAPQEKSLLHFARLGQQAVYGDGGSSLRSELRHAALEAVAWLTPRRIREASPSSPIAPTSFSQSPSA
ncbi:MAG: transglutaminase family protein, partial [Blastopirellula sp. JB062]